MKPLLLMILDGWGYSEKREGNAIALAETPNWNDYWQNFPHTTLSASGLSVGLPEGTMGNSEVGHLNIGAGRVVYQEFTRINKAIEDGSFFKNKTLKDVLSSVKKNSGVLHLMGLASDVGVHSHLDHLYALIDAAVSEGMQKIYIHAFTDGRDSPPDSGLGYIKQIEEKISKDVGRGTLDVQIATVCGRYYAMDRDKRWERIQKAFEAIVNGKGKFAKSAAEAVERSYQEGVTDEFIEPTVIIPETTNDQRPTTDDAFIFINFRADRARELTQAMTDKKFTEFARPALKFSAFATMTQYDKNFSLPVVFAPIKLKNIFGEVISKAGLSQFRIAETEKYAHVTYFFNGGEEKVFKNEDRVLIPSPRDVPTYDKKPQMSAPEVADEAEKRIKLGKYDVIILNFANPDMVGHTGDLNAAIKAVEAVDDCMGRVINAVQNAGGTALVTADHGNCEEMLDSRGKPQTAHSTFFVPFILISDKLKKKKLRAGGALCDIAPTMLELLGLPKPKEMTGDSLLSFRAKREKM